YAKALDAISKSRKDYAGKVKDVKADLAGLAAHLKGAEGVQRDLDTANEMLERINGKNEGYEEQKQGLIKESKELADKMADLEEMRDRETEHETKLSKARAIAESQRGMLEKELPGSDKDLKAMLQEFDSAVDDTEGGYEQLVTKYESMKAAMEKLQEKRIEQCSNRGSLTAAKEANDMVLVQRNSLLDSIIKEHKMKLPAGVSDASGLSSAQFGQVMTTLENKKRELEDAVRDAKKAFTKEDDKAQLAIGELHAKKKQ
ncbi:hypothetical protein TeGR_g2326, partial [Tetraparma gracilis]